MTIAEARLAVLSLTIPDLPFSTTRRAHSIVLKHHNALIHRGKSFRRRRRTVSRIRQKFSLLNSKENFSDPRFARFQTIDIGWSIFLGVLRKSGVSSLPQKTVSDGEVRRLSGVALAPVAIRRNNRGLNDAA